MVPFDLSLVVPITGAVALIYTISRLSNVGSRDRYLPPGPPTIPLLGNLLALPLNEAYLKFAEWAKVYGEVYSLKVGPQTMIVISSFEAVDEILEKNGAITADRAKFEPVRRFAGSTGFVSFTPHGELWRKMRKAAAEVMKPTTRQQNLPVQMAETSQLLFDMQEDPQNAYNHIQRSAISLLFSIVGGMRIPQVDSPLRKKFFDAWDMISIICAPGDAPPVDLIPILNYIPDRFVRNWKARCSVIEKIIEDIIHRMADDVERRLKEGRTIGCHLEIMMQNTEKWGLDRETILGITGGLMIAGTVTSASLLQFVVFLAAAHPETQRRLHEELDRVVGADRSPTLEDLPRLPSINAFIKEVHRFRPIVPLGMPHLAQEDQWYQGLLIPKGSQVMFNSWAAFRNPDYYDNPEAFDPERFIRSPYGTKPGLEERVNIDALKRTETIPFGFGRRRCVGMPMAVDSAALAVANLFWAFEFGSFLDDNGKEIEPDLGAFTAGLSNDPLPFKCKIVTRSDRHAEVIKQNYAQSTSVFEQFERELSKEDREYVETVRARLNDR